MVTEECFQSLRSGARPAKDVGAAYRLPQHGHHRVRGMAIGYQGTYQGASTGACDGPRHYTTLRQRLQHTGMGRSAHTTAR